MFSEERNRRLTDAAPEGQMKVAGGKRVGERRPRFDDIRAVRPGGALETVVKTPPSYSAKIDSDSILIRCFISATLEIRKGDALVGAAPAHNYFVSPRDVFV